jgi:uncharacterized protein (TIGR00290 family)
MGRARSLTPANPAPSLRPPRAWLSWSSGKDSAFALHELRRTATCEVVGLLTVVTDPFDRVSMHGVREELVEAQATALGLPLVKVRIPYPCSNETYEQAMAAALEAAAKDDVRTLVFGDLFLEDVRSYREERLAPLGFRSVFPLWGRPTRALAQAMIDSGIEARICSLDPRRLPAGFAGRTFDARLLQELPLDVDPCGERGEFHTFVTGSPEFRAPIRVRLGPTVERDGFVFADLAPA